MTRTLILTRHAKSSWDAPALTDHDRPLNRRGQRSAVALGKWLRGRGFLPDQVLCSDAARTRETWERMALAVEKTELRPELYHASPAAMRESLMAANGRTVMMLGHNPGIAAFARALVEEPPSHGRFFDYPTGATTVIEFPITDWRELKPGTGDVLAFVVPRELPE